MWGSHLLKHWSSTQKTIALSSGEAELAGIVKGSAEGLGMVSVAKDLGISMSLKVRADSSAAIRICRREGIGRVRHLAVGQLWVQERIQHKEVTVMKIPRKTNIADARTHAWQKGEEYHFRSANMSFILALRIRQNAN